MKAATKERERAEKKEYLQQTLKNENRSAEQKCEVERNVLVLRKNKTRNE